MGQWILKVENDAALLQFAHKQRRHLTGSCLCNNKTSQQLYTSANAAVETMASQVAIHLPGSAFTAVSTQSLLLH